MQSAWYYRGTALDAAGNPDEALRCFQQAATLKPDFAPCRPAWVFLLQRRSDPDGAVKGFSKVVQLTPSDPEAPTI